MMQNHASRVPVFSPRKCMAITSPGGWPALCTGKAGTSSAKRSSTKRVPYSNAASVGRYSFLPSPRGSTASARSKSPPLRAANRTTRSTSVSAKIPAANTSGLAFSSGWTSATPAAKHGIASSSQRVACGPQAPMNGGCGTPSSRPFASS